MQALSIVALALLGVTAIQDTCDELLGGLHRDSQPCVHRPTRKYGPVVQQKAAGCELDCWLFVFLHGLIDTADSWKMTLGAPLQAAAPNSHFVAVTGSRRLIKIAKKDMVSWYDIVAEGSDPRDDDIEGVLDSAAYVNKLIAEKCAELRVPYDRVVVGGFSQGAAAALAASLTASRPYHGVVMLSGRVIGAQYLAKHVAEKSQLRWSLRDTRLIQCQGTADRALDLATADRTHATIVSIFESAGGAKTAIQYRKYQGLGHKADGAVIRDVLKWLVDDGARNSASGEL